MRKKYLSALLFGALLVTSAGTFTSCKDYDDDINNLQEQITANADAIKKLQEIVDNGDYVTGIEKTAEGLKVTFKNSGEKTIALEDEVGSIVTINEDGYLCIDGEPTDITAPKDAESSKDPIIIENGCWSVLQEDGSYKSTNIPVSGVTVTGNTTDGYKLTIHTMEGTQTVELPSAASLISSIDIADNTKTFVISYANFNKPAEWKGERELPENNSVIFVSTALNVRINPVEAPASDVDFTLVNAKNAALSNVVLKANSTDIGGGLTIGDANSRAAYKDNGLFTLAMGPTVLTPSAGDAFVDELTNTAKAFNAPLTHPATTDDCIAYAVNANKSARSKYTIAIGKKEADDMSEVCFIGGSYNTTATSDESPNPTYADLAANTGATTAKEVEIDKDVTYTIKNIEAEEGYLYDMYFDASENDKTNFGLVFDNLNHTFKVTKRPDIVTTDDVKFDLFVHTLDITGAVQVAKYTLSLSNKLVSSVVYDPVEFNLANVVDNNPNNDAFTIDIDKMKEALGAKYNEWINSVDFDKTDIKFFDNENCNGNAKYINVGTNPANPLSITELNSNNQSADDAASVAKFLFDVNDGTTGTDIGIAPNTQYYMQVSFNDASRKLVNTIVVPVKFTASTVAEQFAISTNYQNGTANSIKAFYNNWTATRTRYIELETFFKSYDASATLALDDETTIANIGVTEYSSNDIAGLDKQNASKFDVESTSIYLRRSSEGSNPADELFVSGDGTNRELAYGKALIVRATNEYYKNTQWKFAKASETTYDFTVSVFSPIFEGTIAATDGSKNLSIIANSEAGTDITKDMIKLTDYANNKYNVVPDDETPDGKTLTNSESNEADVWSAAQISNVWVKETGENNYIKEIKLRAYKPADPTAETPAVEGAITVIAYSVAGYTEPTEVTVNVKDIWGYVSSQKINLTLTKNND